MYCARQILRLKFTTGGRWSNDARSFHSSRNAARTAVNMRTFHSSVVSVVVYFELFSVVKLPYVVPDNRVGEREEKVIEI